MLSSGAHLLSAIALTLRAVGGLTTAEIANAFLVPESTMAQRISRAKQTIKASRRTVSHADDASATQRLTAVLHVLYLIFNEGYTSSTGAALHRTDLSGEAIRLTRAIHRRLPDDPEVAGLLALMLLTDARRPARTGPDGELIPLDKQDRQLWNREPSPRRRARQPPLPKGSVGPYQLQAAIAAVHDEAATADETDWPQILALYTLLERMSDNPMVRSIARSPSPWCMGQRQVSSCWISLTRWTDGRALSARRRARTSAGEIRRPRCRSLAPYRAAAGRTTSIPERDYLISQAARLPDNSNAKGPV